MTANTSFTYPMFILLLLMAFTVSAQRIYDGSGRFIGRVDSDKYYDGSGRFIGRIDKDKVYDGSGRFLGRIDKEKLYDSSGKYHGRVDGSRLYDSSGRFVGRIDGNKIYDGSGRFIARTEGLTQKQIVLFFYFYSFYGKDASPANIFRWGLALRVPSFSLNSFYFKTLFVEIISNKNTTSLNPSCAMLS